MVGLRLEILANSIGNSKRRIPVEREFFIRLCQIFVIDRIILKCFSSIICFLPSRRTNLAKQSYPPPLLINNSAPPYSSTASTG